MKTINCSADQKMLYKLMLTDPTVHVYWKDQLHKCDNNL